MKVELHPETRAGEVLVGNFSPEGFEKVAWTTKRKGTTAYSASGKAPTSDGSFFPVFAQRSEMEDRGIEFGE